MQSLALRRTLVLLFLFLLAVPGLAGTQSIVVRNATTGALVPGAKVTVADGVTCYVFKTTGASGVVAFTTAGIKTVYATHPSYLDAAVTVNYSSSSYTVSLKPVPSSSTNTLLSTTAVDADVIVQLASKVGPVLYLGRFSLTQLADALGTVSTVGKFACMVLARKGGSSAAEICKHIWIGALPSAGVAIAQFVGLPMSTKFDLYIPMFAPTRPILIRV